MAMTDTPILTTMAMTDTAVSSVEAPIESPPAMALPSAAGAADQQTWLSILEAVHRADAAEALNMSLWQEVQRLRLENNGLMVELQKKDDNLRLSNSNWQHVAANFQHFIMNNRNVQTAVLQNLLLQEKVRTLEAALAQYEPYIPIHSQAQNEHVSKEDMSNEEVTHPGEEEDGTSQDRKMVNRANRQQMRVSLKKTMRKVRRLDLRRARTTVA